MILTATKKQTFSFDSVFFKNIFLGLNCGIFFNETILVFGKLAIFNSIKIRMGLGKIVWKITR